MTSPKSTKKHQAMKNRLLGDETSYLELAKESFDDACTIFDKEQSMLLGLMIGKKFLADLQKPDSEES